MTVSSEQFRKEYAGNGVAAEFSFNWKVFNKNQLEVIYVNTAGTAQKLTVDTAYSVSGVGSPLGGTITTTFTPASGEKIIILPAYEFQQDTDLRNQGKFYPEIHEDEFDRQTVLSKQLHEVSGRSVKLPKHISPTDFDPELPGDIQDKPGAIVAVNESGDGFQLGEQTVGDISNAINTANTAASNADTATAAAYQAIDDLEEQSAAVLQSTGWFVVGEFATGFTFTAYNQVGRDASGELWSYNGNTLPFTVTAGTVPSEPTYTNRGDAALRSQLANGSQSGNAVARMPITADSLVDFLNVPFIDGRTYQNNGFYPDTVVGGGSWKAVSNADLTQNNGGTFVSKAALQAWYDAAVAAGGATTANLQANLSVLFATGSGTGDAFVRVHSVPLSTPEINIYWFGATGDGVVDDTTPIQKSVDVTYDYGGGSVIVPAATFKTTKYIRLRDKVYIVGEGYGSHITNVATSGFSKVVIASGNMGDPTTGNSMFDEVGYDADTVTAGDFQISLVSAGDVSNFSVGDIVCLQSFEKWSLPAPRNHGKYLHQNVVTDISGSTLTLRYAIPDNYPSSAGSRPTLHKISGTINGYDGNPLFMSKDCGVKNIRLTQTTGLTSGWYALFPCGVNQQYKNIWMDNCSSLIGSNNLSFSSFKNLKGSFEAGLIDLAEWQNNNVVDGVIAHRFAANPSLNRIGIAVSNGTDITIKNVLAFLGGWGRGASLFVIQRGKIENCRFTASGSVDDTIATEAILLGYGDNCEAKDNTIIDQHKYGITVVGEDAVVSGNTIPSTNSGYYSVYAQASVDKIFVHDNKFGIEGLSTSRDRFFQQTQQSPNAIVYGNTGYVETFSEKGKTNWAGFGSTSSTGSYATIKSTNIKGTTGIVRGFRVSASGVITGAASSKTIRLKLGSNIIAQVDYGAADTGDWRVDAIINVRQATDDVHVFGEGKRGTVDTYSNFQIIASGLVSDTTIDVDGQVANAADSVAIYQFIVEPIQVDVQV